jgi:hypothetical protein
MKSRVASHGSEKAHTGDPIGAFLSGLPKFSFGQVGGGKAFEDEEPACGEGCGESG